MRRSGQVSGLVSLVLIFCVLCLCVFTVLTYSAADRERALSELTARRTEEYYAADADAVAWLAERTRALAVEPAEDGAVVSGAFPVGESQTLEVELRREGNGYQILRWQLRYSGEWNTDDRIEVWGGN